MLCSMGVTLCLNVLIRMEAHQAQVCPVSAGDDLGGYWKMRRAGGEMAMLAEG